MNDYHRASGTEPGLQARLEFYPNDINIRAPRIVTLSPPPYFWLSVFIREFFADEILNPPTIGDTHASTIPQKRFTIFA